jgi:hypothetical protein
MHRKGGLTITVGEQALWLCMTSDKKPKVRWAGTKETKVIKNWATKQQVMTIEE